MLFSEIEFWVDPSILEEELAVPPELFLPDAPDFTDQLIDEANYYAEENPITTTILVGTTIATGIYGVSEGYIDEVDLGDIGLPVINLGPFEVKPTVAPTINLADPKTSSAQFQFIFDY
ncbi:MAG: hypothetical protein WAO83_07995 [Fuerstiella sp.]|jgi:hypothetical protein